MVELVDNDSGEKPLVVMTPGWPNRPSFSPLSCSIGGGGGSSDGGVEAPPEKSKRSSKEDSVFERDSGDGDSAC